MGMTSCSTATRGFKACSPTQRGLTSNAKQLTTDETEASKRAKQERAMGRLLLAYKMMLEFSGMQLMEKTGNATGSVSRQERCQHLNEAQGNY